MRQILYILCLGVLQLPCSGQTYDDYIGAGHSDNVSITSSDNTSNGIKTVDGDGLDLDIQGASSFLAHATLGATIEEVEKLTQVGYEEWIKEQLAIPVTSYTLPTVEIIFKLYDNCKEIYGLECDKKFNVNTYMWRYAWWHNTMRSPDKLRHKVALALSEIVVLSDRSELESFPHGIAAFYDILSRNAFGNYRDILHEVTLNPSMGFYLSHINNPKTIPILNIRPDENYAREIMQLFSIGLYDLNIDGSRKIDLTTGKWIPTYDNEDIKGLAKVFTGLSGSKWSQDTNTSPVVFGKRFSAYSLIDPMKMYEEWHEKGEKKILGDYLIPAGQSGMKDINDAIDHLFNHPNVGPFLAQRLIQRLVKSNPTPEYIARIAQIFNDNGSGVRGDLSAVIKAILLDTEAMECYWAEDISSSTLRAPTLRLTQLLIGLKAVTKSDWFWNSGLYFNNFTAHHPMSSPTVFNHYAPDYVPDSEFAYYNLVGPEYQILNSSTSSNYVNYMLLALLGDYLNDRYNLIGNKRIPNVLNEPFLNQFVKNQEEYAAYLTDEQWLDLSFSPSEMVDYLDLLLANGRLSENTKANITESIKRRDLFDPISSAYYAAFLIMIHPDYLIMK